jgi:hypothetical protein
MTRSSEIASFRVPCGTLGRLRRIAHVLSLKSGADTTWADIIRATVERTLADLEKDAKSSTSCE